MRRIAMFLAVVMTAAAALSGCGKKDAERAGEPTPSPAATERAADSAELKRVTENTIGAEIMLTSGETIELELYPDLAPKTVANFIKNANEGFYTGTIFHRVIEGFMIQGGGYDEALKLKSVSETVEGEFEDNGIENPLPHERGVISMARTSQPNSASTQFFIVHEDSEYLDGQYAAFGRVTAGMEVVDEIASARKAADPPSGFDDLTEELYVIESITIDSSAAELEGEPAAAE